MRDLTQHLTTRADDNHAPPVSVAPKRGPALPERSTGCQVLVRFFALRRIKPHAPPLVRAPVNSFEFQSCDRTPGGVLIVLTAAPKVSKPPTPSTHRLRRGLPGYLILFAPHAFAPQRQLRPSKSPSPLVFLLISTHFTATLGIPLASSALKSASIRCTLRVEPLHFTSDLTDRLRALYAQ